MTDNQNPIDIEPKPRPSILSDTTTRRSSKSIHLKFAAPLKIHDIDSTGDYLKHVTSAVAIGIAQMFIGATLMIIFLYSLSTGDSHAIIYSLAFHFFSVEAILTLNHSNGWSKSLRIRHRRCIHIILQLCAVSCAATGTILIFLRQDISIIMDYHGITGFVTLALALITLIIGPLAFYGTNRQKHFHIIFGTLTFMLSSISLCLGLITPMFKTYVNSCTILYIILSFIIFYTLLVIIMCFCKHVSH